MKTCKRFGMILLILVMAVLLFPVSTLAAGSIDLNRAHSLTVTADYGRIPVSGLRLDAYQISTVDESGKLTVVERYRDYAEDLDIRGRNDEAWQRMAQILSREIMLDQNLRPSCSAVTENDGAAKFTDISMGLYLIQGSSVEKDGYVYSTLPFFAILPEQDLNSNTWNYDVVVNAKPGQKPVRADYEVMKIWKDDCHKDQRPQSITISLICDGNVYDTVTLPHDGTWNYTWNELDTNHQWTVTEEPLEGYKNGEVQQEGNTFIVTNICDKTANADKSQNPILPQTGQLWWPVPVLLAAGLLFLVIGLIRRRGDTDEK